MNEDITLPNTPARSYAYAADTAYTPSLANVLKDVNLLYHETTYLKELEERAHLRFHSTTTQAADIAKRANVEKLLIGHFSSKYEYLDQFAIEAQEIFPNTELAVEGVSYRIG
jgi:ribonuclease Z